MNPSAEGEEMGAQFQGCAGTGEGTEGCEGGPRGDA